MANDQKPMDQQRLAGIREMIEWCALVPTAAVTALLGAHDFEKDRADKAERQRNALRGVIANLVKAVADDPGEIVESVAAAVRERDEARQALGGERERCDQLERERNTLYGAVARLANVVQRVAIACGWPDDQPVEDPGELVESVFELRRRAEQAERERTEARERAGLFKVLAELPGECWPECDGASAVTRLVEHAEIGRQWCEDSSLAKWFPITAERLADEHAARVRAEDERDEARAQRDRAERWGIASGKAQQRMAGEIKNLREHFEAHRSAAANLRMPVSADRGGIPCSSSGGDGCPPAGWHYVFGGPYTSYTLPEPDKDGVLHWWKFDEDEGQWREMETLPARIVSEEEEIEAEEKAEAVVDALRAEVARLRSRVRVEAEDVERAGVTWVAVSAWLTSAGWSKTITSNGWRFKPRPDGFGGMTIGGTSNGIAGAVRFISSEVGRTGLDILDEMAAMEVPDAG